MFVILSGSSGVGKNTVIKEMQKSMKNLVMVPTFTTREKRVGEVEGEPYFYVTKAEFQDKIKNNELIEHELIHNNYYGSSIKIFEEYIRLGKIITKDIGVEGAQNLTKKLSDKTPIIKIFLTVKNKNELKKRLRGRGEKQIKLRLKRYGYEQKQKNKFDFIIFNDNLENTSELVKTLIKTDPSDYLFNKKLENLNTYKIKYYVNKLTSGKVLKPVKICKIDDKIFVVGGAEKLVASLVCKIPVAKVVVKKNINQDKYCNKFQVENIEKSI